MTEHMKKTEGLTRHVQGFFTAREGRSLYELAKGSTLPIIEIGSFMGKSTIWLARGSQAGAGVPVVAIDSCVGVPIEYRYQGRQKFSQPARVVNRGAKGSKHGRVQRMPRLTQRQTFERNIAAAGVSEIVTFIPKESRYAIKEVPRKIGVLFIDGGHEYEEVKLDYDLYSPLVVKGGWVAFHDLSWPGPARLIGERITTDEGYGKPISITGDGSDLLIVQKLKNSKKRAAASGQ